MDHVRRNGVLYHFRAGSEFGRDPIILLFDQFTQRAGLRTQDAEEISRQSPAEAVRIVEPTTVAERG